MKLICALTLTALCAVTSPALMATPTAPASTGCAAKQQDIRNQIDQAKAAGNQNQQAGLETALNQSTAHCNEPSLKKERENKVFKARQEVAQRQSDLDKAMKKGDANKINSRKEKLAESRKQLQQATEELSH